MRYRIYEDVYPIIGGCICLFILGLLIHHYLIILSVIIITISVFLFRDPIRVTPVNKNIIVAPCDGYLHRIEKVIKPYNSNKYTKHEKYYKITFYINIFNVQLNYMPITSKVIDMQYYFFYPQKNVITIETQNKDILILTQTANLFTYSIICDLETNQHTLSGEKIGMIKIGNTIELYIPNNFKILLHEGQSCIGGETIIAVNNDQKKEDTQYRVH